MSGRSGRPAGVASSVTGAQLQSIFAHLTEAAIVVDERGVVRAAAGGMRTLGGYEPAELVGRSMLELLHPDEREHMIDRMARWVGRAGEGLGPTVRIRTAGGDWIDCGLEAVTGPAVAPFAVLTVLTPAARGEGAADQEDRLTRISSAFTNLPSDRIDDGIRTAMAEMGSLPGVDRVCLVLIDEVERVFLNRFEWCAPGIESFQERDRAMPLVESSLLQSMQRMETVHIPSVASLGDDWRLEKRFWESRGTRSVISVPLVDEGRLLGFLGFEAVQADQQWDEHYLATLRSGAGIIGQALARAAIEAELAHQARHDPVTGLGNRWQFLDRLRAAVAELGSDRQHPPGLGVGVVVFDLDRFKVVNDSLGHAAGDALLSAVAGRFSHACRPQDSLARLGGDELVLLVADAPGPEEVADLARTYQQVLDEPVEVHGHETVVAVSAGVAFTAEPMVAAEDLLRDADAAMYTAKAQGRNQVVVFDDRLRAHVRERLRREHELRQALQRDELEVHYQPELILDTGEVVAAEALVRWRHPHDGLLTAAGFIDLAEESGLILDIGAWVLREACRQLGEWRRVRPDHSLLVRVNLSARQVGQPDLVPMVIDAIGEAGVPASSLCFEITETTAMADPEVSLQVLEKLRGLGVELAIDDFGTGYSSLSYLKRLPFDVVKIDRSFVDGLGTDVDDESIVSAIISLARSLGLAVTAEGVETELQRSELLRLGCGRAQGYLLGRPVPAAEFDRLLAR